MFLYEKFGLDKRVLSTNYEIENLNESLSFTRTDKAWLITVHKETTIFSSSFISFRFYLLDEKKKAMEYAQSLLGYAIEFFFGSWRSLVQRKNSKKNIKFGLWMDEFRETIFWGSCLEEWKKIAKIAEYPDDECLLEPEEKKETRAWLLLLAAVLRGELFQAQQRYIDAIEQGRQKREKLLLTVLRTILEGDVEKLNQELKTYLQHYKKKEFPKDSIPEKLAIDGTFLINYARHRGLAVEYPPEFEDHIVKLDE